ncbi:MAG: response regulator transcription factor [Bacteriovoracaceae bacterium]
MVDDSKTMRVLIKKFLKLSGYSNIIQAKDGEEALGQIEETKHKIDIIISDLNMLPMGGLNFLKNLKTSTHQSAKDAKFLIMSSASEMDKAQKAIELGAYDYLVKPISKDSLSEKILSTMTKL